VTDVTDASDAILHLSLPVRDLAAAREFYEQLLGCRVGRVRDDWLDVWFFGLQLTLQERPTEVAANADPGVRHFGVTLTDEQAFRRLVDRIDAQAAHWIERPIAHDAVELSGKVGGKLADPSGNVIEVKYYADRAALLAGR
jgi:extradiol dioxygenase family protein